MTQLHGEAELEALRRSETRYRRLFQTAKDGILILDAHSGKILDANKFMADLLGREPADLMGKELWEIGLFGDIEASKAAFKTLQEKSYLRYDDLPVVDREDRTVEVEVVANVYDEGGRQVAQCNVRDISERMRLQRQIEEQSHVLAEEHRNKDEFLAMLSHELRNPLAPILSATQLLSRGGDIAIQRQACDVIERQVANLTRLTGDLLEVSRVVNGRFRLRRAYIDLKPVVRHAVAAMTPLMESRGHTITVTLPGVAVSVHADATRLEEVVVNLLNNAAKYTKDGGLIELTLELQGPHAVLHVRDSGIGIEPELLPRVFDLFSQGQRSLDRSEGGLGIGLCLVQRLVELHDGTVEAHSEGLGEGSEFVVRLPVAVSREAAEPPAYVESTARDMRVLVVDDNEDACMMLAHLLRQGGYGVQTSFTSAAALRAAQAWRPDVCLLDIGLPDMDGFELARRLRRDYPSEKMRLVAITGYGTERDIQLALDAGFDEHLLKPVDFAVLDASLAAWKPAGAVR